MPSFKVPFGISEDHSLVAAESANKSHKYFCPSCGLPLTFRAGTIKAKHFAHRVGTGCSAESVIHAIAKRLIEKVSLEWIAGGPGPQIARKCEFGQELENYACDSIVQQQLPRNRVSIVTLERTLPNLRKPDVMFLLDDTPTLAIEIFATHKVDSAKAEDLGELPWIELDAAAILINPYCWSPIQMNLKGKAICDSCRQVLIKESEKSNSVMNIFGLHCPSGYHVKAVSCYHCKLEIPFYTWQDIGQNDPVWSEIKDLKLSFKEIDIFLDRKFPPPAPRPRSVQFRYSKTLQERHWVNVCPSCEWIQSSSISDY